MKKQLLIAAVVASMSSIAIADISLSGRTLLYGDEDQSKAVLYKDKDKLIEAGVTLTGKSGDTSVVAKIGLDAVNAVEQLYATSSVAGIKVKVGTWKSGKGELGHNAAGDARVAASTSFGGVKLSYSDRTGAGSTDVAIAGTIAGLKISHKIKDTSTETKVSGSMGGVNASVHTKEKDNGKTDTSYTLKTEIQGIALTYVNTTSDEGTLMDGFIGKNAKDSVTGDYIKVDSASAIGISTSIAGNKVTLKSTDINGTDNKKLIVTRKLASGATFEATYDDNADSLDLELAVKF